MPSRRTRKGPSEPRPVSDANFQKMLAKALRATAGKIPNLKKVF